MSRLRFDVDWVPAELERCRELIAERPAPQRWTKPTGSGMELVTDIDLAIERLLISAIQEQLPDAVILSEESSPDPDALAAPICAVIDPIDGTEELVAGRPGFAISVAFFDHGQPVAAFLDLPAQDRRFRCTAGGSVWLNGATVALSEVDRLSEARLAVSATQYGMDALRWFWDSIDVAALIPTPAFTPKFAAVLAGDCDAALYLPVRPHRTAIWDYAAVGLLMREAGGWFGSTDGTDLYEQRPFTYSGGWVATPMRLREQLFTVADRLGASDSAES
jgi:myo-inositol-1(or 4)-monophosphatase